MIRMATRWVHLGWTDHVGMPEGISKGSLTEDGGR